jgi:hypothetical protein
MMSLPKEAAPAKLVIGLLFCDSSIQDRVLKALQDRFGPMDFLSDARPFTFTGYYEREMGSGILRQTAAFVSLTPPEGLREIKLFTNSLEAGLSVDGRRRVNIDPGLLSEERFILATGKNYTHRIYLGQGIYADLTLIYQKGAFQVLPWTYPDHRDQLLLHYLQVLRQKLIFQRTGRLPRKAASKGDKP